MVGWWGQPLIYNSGNETNGPFNQNGAPKHRPDKFDLSSAGPDKKQSTQDDTANWPE